MIRYTDTAQGVEHNHLEGFFEGWPHPPSTATHLAILHSSPVVILAVDDEADRMVGFVTAISDGVLSAYIPLLEVLPGYRGRGIGRELMRRVLDALPTNRRYAWIAAAVLTATAGLAFAQQTDAIGEDTLRLHRGAGGQRLVPRPD